MPCVCRSTIVEAIMWILPSKNDKIYALLKEKDLSAALEVTLNLPPPAPAPTPAPASAPAPAAAAAAAVSSCRGF